MARFVAYSAFVAALAATHVCAQMTTSGVPGSAMSTFVVHGTKPADIAHQIPCERVHLNSDGSYTILATVVYGDGSTFADTTLGGEEYMILNARCGHARYWSSGGSLPALMRQNRN